MGLFFVAVRVNQEERLGGLKTIFASREDCSNNSGVGDNTNRYFVGSGFYQGSVKGSHRLAPLILLSKELH